MIMGVGMNVPRVAPELCTYAGRIRETTTVPGAHRVGSSARTTPIAPIIK